ncbi:DNA ligase D [Sphingoaurantiacus capsulatus]|uniref:DNA ligase (ATP) n=1 Tax=Sphingoaurantiacus capsulatus TaxID=1771310 RepID=A0ABV7XC59_9SPHN
MAARAKDALSAYNAKRDFKKTPEPPGKVAVRTGDRFIVQKHAATRLHYDFRLEIDGVLKSWAVTRGPSCNPDDKRLAVRTEDHPMSYASFEGSIPKGEYGGGTVMLWDDGSWEPLHDPREGLESGKLHFRLKGKRMKGEWLLVRLKPDKPGGRENWLLRKVEDKFASSDTDLTADNVTSIKTGRSMADIAEGVKPKRATKAAPPPKFRDVQLATLADVPPAGSQWVHEVKYDGYRCLLVKSGDKVAAYTRKGNDWTEEFGSIARAAAAIDAQSAAIDGEVVALDDKGMPSFSKLQNALKDGGELKFFAFDLLELDGTDLTHLPLLDRKARLQPLIADVGDPLLYSDHIAGDGEQVLQTLCKFGGEGIVSKRGDGKYIGKRSTSWLKVKCVKRQEFVIGGWSKSDKGRGFASLLLGTYEGGKLKYAGRVGTGFDAKTIADIAKRMKPLTVDKPAFDKLTADARRGAQWIKPQLVAEVAFGEITPDGLVRHGSFIGLRADKPAKEIGLDKAVTVDGELNRSGVHISSPDKVMFPELGATKRELVDYYEAVAEAMLPHVAGRPLSLVRCPQGRGKECFFQKHDSGIFPAGVRQVRIDETKGKAQPYVYIDNVQGLIACLQMGTLEFHIWGSRIDHLERPDRLVIDLDPDEGLGFDAVREAAKEVKKRLADHGLDCWPLLTGGKGLHLVAPLAPKHDWEAVKAFAKNFAEEMAGAHPDRFTSKMSKAGRAGRIFIDWLRNQRGATAIAPFSTRARLNAPIAVPVSWRELAKVEGSSFTIADVKAALRHARHAVLASKQEIPS